MMMNNKMVFDNNHKAIVTLLTAALETTTEKSTIDLNITLHLPPSASSKLLEIPKQPKLLPNNIPDDERSSVVLLPSSEGGQQTRQPPHLQTLQHQHQQSSQLRTTPEKHPSTTTSSRRRRVCRVSFAPEVEYINILHKEDYTPTEYKATWYSVEECFLMRQEIKEILNSSRWNNPILNNKSKTITTTTMRGLEPYTTSGMEDLQIIKQCCIYPVLIEQERQQRKRFQQVHKPKPKRIAKIYKQSTLHKYSINKAIEIAKQDAKDAQQEYYRNNQQQLDLRNMFDEIRSLWVQVVKNKNKTTTTTTTEKQQIIRSSSSDDNFDNKCQFLFFDPSDWFPPSSPLMVVPY